jgi:hypothetical protein
MHNIYLLGCAHIMFQSADARRALPCWDEPAFKATFDVVLVVPKDRVALSNMVNAYYAIHVQCMYMYMCVTTCVEIRYRRKFW